MEKVKQFFFIGFLITGILIVFFALFSSSKSFSSQEAEKMSQEAAQNCISKWTSDSDYIASMDESDLSITFKSKKEYIEFCRDRHSIERYHVGVLEWALILILGIPALVFIFSLFIGLTSNPFSEKPLSKEQQSKLPKSQDGTLTVGPGRAKVDGTSLFQSEWDVHPVKYNLENVKDIIKRNHIAKGDYSDHFGRLVSFYLDPGPEGSGKSFVSKQEIIGYLEWAIDTVPKVYAGSQKQIEDGNKKMKTLEKYIERIKSY
tara:strand:- start:740 stop:1519 length:780 start_codon:yes stop_codon:yes gene_type:complete